MRPRRTPAPEPVRPVGGSALGVRVECRSCGAVFDRAAPPPYGTICPYCVGAGEIVTLIEVPAEP